MLAFAVFFYNCFFSELCFVACIIMTQHKSINSSVVIEMHVLFTSIAASCSSSKIELDVMHEEVDLTYF